MSIAAKRVKQEPEKDQYPLRVGQKKEKAMLKIDSWQPKVLAVKDLW